MSVTATDEEFDSTPSPTGYFTPSNMKDALCIFVPQRVVYDEPKPWGESKTTAYAAVFVIQGEGAGSEFPSAGIANSKMVSQLAGRIGGKILGRVVEGEGKGGKKPFIIAPPTEEDKAIARTWLAAGGNLRTVQQAQQAAAREAAEPSVPRPPTSAPGELPPPPPVLHSEPPF